VGLDVFDVDGTRVSASHQTTEILAGHEQFALQTMHQLQMEKYGSKFRLKNLKSVTHFCSFFVLADEEREIRVEALLEGLQLQTPQLLLRFSR